MTKKKECVILCEVNLWGDQVMLGEYYIATCEERLVGTIENSIALDRGTIPIICSNFTHEDPYFSFYLVLDWEGQLAAPDSPWVCIPHLYSDYDERVFEDVIDLSLQADNIQFTFDLQTIRSLSKEELLRHIGGRILKNLVSSGSISLEAVYKNGTIEFYLTIVSPSFFRYCSRAVFQSDLFEGIRLKK